MSSLALRLLAGAAALTLLAGPVLAQDATKPAEAPATAAPAPAPAADQAGKPDDPVAATVNGQPILRSEVLEAINSLPQQYRQMPAAGLRRRESYPLSRNFNRGRVTFLGFAASAFASILRFRSCSIAS